MGLSSQASAITRKSAASILAGIDANQFGLFKQFVAETKGSMSEMDLDGVEQAKVACARKLFNEISTSGVRYHQVSSYDELRSWANAME